MKNEQILKNIVENIRTEMKRRHLSQEKLAKLCKSKISPDKEATDEKGISQSTISNFFRMPSSISLENLLKLCNALDLNLSDILEEPAEPSTHLINKNLIVDPKDSVFKGYITTSESYLYFLSTESNHIPQLLNAKLNITQPEGPNKTTAHLKLYTPKKDSSSLPGVKHFEGNISIYPNIAMMLNLISSDTNDVWFLIFNHGSLNKENLHYAFGCGATLSAGKGTHYPTIHTVCLSDHILSGQEETIIKSRLRLHNNRLIITKKNLTSFLKTEKLDASFKKDIFNIIERQETDAYIIPLNALNNFSSNMKASYMYTSKLLQYSSNESFYKLPPEEDNNLFYALNL